MEEERRSRPESHRENSTLDWTRQVRTTGDGRWGPGKMGTSELRRTKPVRGAAKGIEATEGAHEQKPVPPAACHPQSTSTPAHKALCPALRTASPVTDGQAPAGGTESSHSTAANSLNVCGLWTMGHGGGSGQNRLSSV